MEEKDLKTSPKQRIVIIVIAVLMLGSIIASYAAIVINGGNQTIHQTPGLRLMRRRLLSTKKNTTKRLRNLPRFQNLILTRL